MKDQRCNRLITIVSLTALLTTCLILAAAPSVTAHKHPKILVEGVPMRGTANGMFFDDLNQLWVANIFGRSISVLDPESGEVLMRLGPAERVFFPDDLTFSDDGSLFWTDPFIGTVSRINPEGGDPFVVFGFPGANPITFSSYGELFFAQCFQPETLIYEAHPEEILPVRPIFSESDLITCAANGMDWFDGDLYSPRWFEGQVVKVDTVTGAMTTITDDWGVPAAVKFDSQGRLHAVNHGNGEVVRINLSTGKRELLAQLPIGLDNLAFDSSDRLYVSSSIDGFVVEIMPNGRVRTVSPGGMAVAGGVAVIGKTVYVNEPQAIRGFNRNGGRQVSVSRSVGFIDPIASILPTSMEADGDHLILMSWITGGLLIWDPEAESVVLSTEFVGPVDAVRFQGDLIVSELSGNVVRATWPDLEEREILATLEGVPTGLAATDDDLYVSDSALGTIFQIVRDGELLNPRLEIATGLTRPEGIALRHRGKHRGKRLLVVEAGTDSLKEVNLKSGKIKTIASNLGFYDPLPGLLPPFDLFLNNVVIDNKGAMYINADEANVIYKFKR